MQKRIKIVFLLLVLAMFLPTAVLGALDLDYRLTLKPSAVDVYVKIKTKTDTLCFEYDREKLKNLTVKSPEGLSLRIDDEDKTLCVDTAGSGLSLKYSSPISDYDGEVFDYESPPVNVSVNNDVIVFGKNIFLIPSEDISTKSSVEISLDGLRRLYSNFSLSDSSVEFNDIRELLSLMIVAGSTKFRQDQIKGNRYLSAMLGDWKKTEQNRVLRNYRTIVDKQISSWGFLPAETVLSCFIKSEKTAKAFGFQYANSLIYIFPADMQVQSPDFLKLLAHEHFHLWNGYHYPPKHRARQTEWFHEGLTNYYALMNIASLGFIPESDFLNYLSRLYLKYDSSYKPAEPLEHKLLRDTFVVMAMDIEIIRATDGKKSLDDLLPEINKNTELWTKGYDNEMIKMELLKLANWDISGFFGRYIESATKINMSPYWTQLGLTQGKDLILQKYKDSGHYAKWFRKE